MDSFKSYMDKVKAEDALKERTKKYVSERLYGNPEISAVTAGLKIIKRRTYSMKKIISIAAAAVICIGLAGGAFAYYNTPVSYLSVDINPSLELGINGIGKVVKTEAFNEDGQKILESAAVKNRSVKEAVSELIRTASEKGYIAADGSTVVSVTAESKDSEAAEKLRKEGEDGVSEAMKAKNLPAVVYANSSDLAMRSEAKALGISPGKYKVIKIMQSLDPTLKASDYKDAKMTDLIVKADELLDAYKSGALTTEQQLALKGVDAAAEKVRNANGTINRGSESELREQEQNRGFKTAEQEKEKNQDNGKGGSSVNGKNGNAPSTSPSACVSPSPSASAAPSPSAANDEARGGGKTSSGSSAGARDNGKGPNRN